MAATPLPPGGASCGTNGALAAAVRGKGLDSGSRVHRTPKAAGVGAHRLCVSFGGQWVLKRILGDGESVCFPWLLEMHPGP